MSEQLQKLVGDTKSVDVGRRRRLILGGGLGGAFAAFKSGSALAGGVCNSPSAFGSIAANPDTSHKPHTFDGCSASSKGVYMNNGNATANWGSVSLDTTLEGAGFPATVNLAPTKKLRELLVKPDWKPDYNLVVLYLDVKTGRAAAVISESDVFAMWDILFNGGTSNPKFSGWTADTVRLFYGSWVGKVII